MAVQLRGGASVKGQLVSNGIATFNSTATFEENVTMKKDLTITGTLKNSSSKSYVTADTESLEHYDTSTTVDSKIANSAKLEVKLFDTLPDPEEKYKNVLALVPIQGAEGSNVKKEYICINKGTTASPDWAWEQIGTTDFTLTWVQPTSATPNVYTLNTTQFALATVEHCGMMTKEQAVKLDGIETGAEVNKIAVVKLNGNPLTITDKTVNIETVSANNGKFTLTNGSSRSVEFTANQSSDVSFDIPEQVQADWSVTDTSSKAYILNKPAIGSEVHVYTNTVTTSGGTATITLAYAPKIVQLFDSTGALVIADMVIDETAKTATITTGDESATTYKYNAMCW